MRLMTFSSPRPRPTLVSHKLLGMPTIDTVSPPSLADGGVEVTDRASGERSVRPMGDVEAELRGAA